MELWMLFVLLVILLACGAFAAYIFIQEARCKQNHDLFFSLPDLNPLGFSLGGDVAEEYDATKRQVYGMFVDKSIPFEPVVPEVSSEDEEEDEEEHEEKEAPIPWQRGLPSEAKNKLKVMLVKRAMICLPAAQAIDEHFVVKAKFYRQQMLAPQHWKQVQDARFNVDTEVNFIRREAEAIQEGYGFKDLVFRDAGHLMYLQRAKLEKEAEAQRLESERKADIERQEKLALKMSKALLREVDEDEKNAQRRRKAAK